MIGASAAISGTMAAAMRFVFQQGGPLAVWRRQRRPKSYRVPAASLYATLRDPRFLMFLAVWIGLNLLLGLGTLPIARGGAASRLAGAYRWLPRGPRAVQCFRSTPRRTKKRGPSRAADPRRPIPLWGTTPLPYSSATLAASERRFCGRPQARLDAAPQHGAGRRGRNDQIVPAGGTRRRPRTSPSHVCRPAP